MQHKDQSTIKNNDIAFSQYVPVDEMCVILCVLGKGLDILIQWFRPKAVCAQHYMTIGYID